MIHDEICTYEVCKLAKEKGFPQHIGNDAYIVENEYDVEYEVGCHYSIQFIPDYLPTITAPTQSLLQRWLREEKALHIQITLWEKGWYNDIWVFEYYEEEKEYSTRQIHQSTDFDTYELALEDAIKYALENLI